ncbi:MAG: SRPBCC family protein [Flavobacteriaceae bacterium]|nr:SRPBCC family protein [Flavobacteriaceae bacterium]
MKALKYIIFVLLILIIGTSIYIAVQPNSYEVTRSRTINAPAAVIYNNVIDFKNWEAWSAWVEAHPETVITLADQTEGVGGSYTWKDNDGVGRMETLSTTANVSIEQKLQIDEYAPSQVNWMFEPIEDGKTKVSWQMLGEDLPFMLKAMAAFTGGFENMIGPDFERGLEKLDSLIVESMKVHEITINGITEYGGGFYLYKTTSARGDNISQMMGQQFGEIMQFAIPNGIQPSGMPFTIYLNDMNVQDGNVIMSNAIPVKEKIVMLANSNILCDYMPKTRSLKVTSKGNYTNLTEAWSAAMQHIADNNLQRSTMFPFEIYTNDPGAFPNPADWVTEIYIPLIEEN